MRFERKTDKTMMAPAAMLITLLTAVNVAWAMEPLKTPVTVTSRPASHSDSHAVASQPGQLTSRQALEALIEGNRRFAEDHRQHPHETLVRLHEVESGQHPFAAIVACADSRVPVEHLFDCGIGDVFVVRVAGNVCDNSEAASIEYAVEHLGVQVVVVLGHTSCGAVTAAVAGGELKGCVGNLLHLIEPAVAEAHHGHAEARGAALVKEAIYCNVYHSIDDLLKRSDVVRERSADGTVLVKAAVYHLDSGKVQWLPPRLTVTSQPHAASQPAHAALPAGDGAAQQEKPHPAHPATQPAARVHPS